MSRKLYFTFILLLVLSGLSCFAQVNELIVVVRDINEPKGVIYVALYDSDENFLKKDSFSKSAKATQGNIVMVFNNLPFGEYAISAIHDANENKILDKNFFGIPTEGFGFLNGEMGMFGPPSFKKVKVVWKGGNEKFEVPLKYF